MNKADIKIRSILLIIGLGASGFINSCLPGTPSENDSPNPNAITTCETWGCDSLVLRALLDSNGQPNTRITRGDGDRITWLSLTGIHKVPLEIAKLNGLEYLILDGDFPEVPNSMGQLKLLDYLEIRSDKLNDIGDWLGHLFYLETLIIRSKSLTKLPSSASQLKYLRRLDLADNLLDSLPVTIGHFVALEELVLNNNRFQELPSTIGNCTRLNRLELIDNQLKNMPTSIGNLKELMFLLLRENPISEFPESITNLKKIENLDMYALPFCAPSANVRNWLDLVNSGWERQILASGCIGV